MTGEIERPQRALTFTLRIGADTRKDLAQHLEHLAQQVYREEIAGGPGTFGGPSCGGNYELVEIDMPHEKYFEELHAYLEERRAARALPVEGNPS
jgi:hypothetical protein